MKNKFNDLIRKNINKNIELQNQMYSSGVNSQINEKYKFGEDKAITRKALYQVIQDLSKLGIDISKYSEFIDYNNYVENEKVKMKNTYTK